VQEPGGALDVGLAQGGDSGTEEVEAVCGAQGARRLVDHAHHREFYHVGKTAAL
jgi:hypothetical protein